MPVCPDCDRLFLRNELFESEFECPFPDCEGHVPGRTEYPELGADRERDREPAAPPT